MNKINYDKELTKFLTSLKKEKKIPTLLLHSCCAPCSSYVLEYLSEFFRITIYYYNPNISPKEEFEKRAKEQERLLKEMPLNRNIDIIKKDYDNNIFFSITKGLETLPEGGKRCSVCYKLRLEKTAILAKEKQFDYFTTTLSVSPYKNSDNLNKIGKELEKKYGINYLCADFKKNNGYKRSIELSKIYNLYRQDYCGCIFSKTEREKQKNRKTEKQHQIHHINTIRI